MRRESLSHGVRTSCCRPCRIWRLGSGLQLQHGSVRGAGQHPLRRHPHGYRCPDRHGHACTGQVPAHQLLPEPACSSAHMWILLHAPPFSMQDNDSFVVFWVQVRFRGAKAAVPPPLHRRGRGGLSWSQWSWSRIRCLKFVHFFYRYDPSCLREQRVSAFSSCSSTQVSPPRRWGTGMNMWSTGERCGPPTVPRLTGCVSWPTPATAPRTGTSPSFAYPWTCQVGLTFP